MPSCWSAMILPVARCQLTSSAAMSCLACSSSATGTISASEALSLTQLRAESANLLGGPCALIQSICIGNVVQCAQGCALAARLQQVFSGTLELLPCRCRFYLHCTKGMHSVASFLRVPVLDCSMSSATTWASFLLQDEKA